MKKMRALALILTLACALSLTGCASAQQKKQTAIGFYLDTVITLTPASAAISFSVIKSTLP